MEKFSSCNQPSNPSEVNSAPREPLTQIRLAASAHKYHSVSSHSLYGIIMWSIKSTATILIVIDSNNQGCHTDLGYHTWQCLLFQDHCQTSPPPSSAIILIITLILRVLRKGLRPPPALLSFHLVKPLPVEGCWVQLENYARMIIQLNYGVRSLRMAKYAFRVI